MFIFYYEVHVEVDFLVETITKKNPQWGDNIFLLRIQFSMLAPWLVPLWIND